MFSLYLVTNTVNGKRYIGITKFPVRKRWLQHLQASRNAKAFGALRRAILKYGDEAFTLETIGQSDDWEALKVMEQDAIQAYNTFAPTGHGYNLTRGGDGNVGMVMPDEAKQRIAARNKGKTHSAASRARLSASMKKAIAEGRKVVGFSSDAHREAFFAASKASHVKGWTPSDATRALWSAQRTGRLNSPETRAKISKANTGKKVPARGRKGRAPWNKGIPLTPEAKAKAAVLSQGASNGRARPLELDGVPYAYMKDAMQQTGRSATYIYARLRDGTARYLDGHEAVGSGGTHTASNKRPVEVDGVRYASLLDAKEHSGRTWWYLTSRLYGYVSEALQDGRVRFVDEGEQDDACE